MQPAARSRSREQRSRFDVAPSHHPRRHRAANSHRGRGADRREITVKVLVLHTLPPEHVESGRVKDEFALDGAAQAIGRVIADSIVEGTRGGAVEMLELL